MLNILAVFTGGGTGAICRYLATKLSAKYIGSCIWGTLSVNILGCFLIGYIFALTMQKAASMPPAVKLFLTAGFLGGLTTFSTFSMEAFGFLKDGKIFNKIEKGEKKRNDFYNEILDVLALLGGDTRDVR